MKSSLSINISYATVAVAMLTACSGGGSGAGVPNAASSLAAAQNRLGQQGSSIAFSGEYTGKFRERRHGASKLILILSQSQNTLGGALISKEGSQGLAAVVAWVANGHAISGTGSSSAGSAGFCTFAMSGKYKYRRLTGTYTAVYGCTGQTGTFNLWHKCYFQTTGSEAIRPETGVKPC